MRILANHRNERDTHAGADGHGTRAPRRSPALRLAGLFAVLLLICGPVVALHVDRNKPLSVLDEFAYADYLHQIDHGRWIVRHGEVSTQEALRDLACRGYAPSTWNDRPPCDAPTFDPSMFPNAGIDSADIHPPTYFVVTYLGARAIRGLGLTDDLVDAGRLFGAVWMAAGLLALWCLLRALGAGPAASAAGLALVAAGPMLLQQWHYLTPDAPNILVGSLVVLAALDWERSRRRWGVLALAGALAMAIKGPNLVVVVVGAGYVAARGWLRRDDDEATAGPGHRATREYAVAAGSLLAGAAVASLAWVIVRAAVALPGTTPMEEAERTGILHPAQVLENVARFITPWDREPSSLYPLAVITSYLFVAFLVVALATLSRRDVRWSLAGAVGVVLIAGPLLLVAVNFVVRGSYAIVEPRYGTTLVPAQCAIAASFWSGRTLTAVGALAVFAPLAVLLRLLL